MSKYPEDMDHPEDIHSTERLVICPNCNFGVVAGIDNLVPAHDLTCHDCGEKLKLRGKQHLSYVHS